MTTTAAPECPESLTGSASRLTILGGEKGKPGCERSYQGAYCHGLKQSGSTATEFGSALHNTADVLQTTGVLLEPESRVSTVLSAGIHLLSPWDQGTVQSGAGTGLLIEWEHWGFLPPLADGTLVPFVAYLDGSSDDTGSTNCLIVQDLKTTSDKKYALTAERESDYYLGRNIQAMLYAAILLLIPHWYCPPLPEGVYGPKHWRWWDAAEQRGINARTSVRLRWIYFLTRGTERAWDVSVFVDRAAVEGYLLGQIMPLVEKMTALHRWHDANPSASLDQIDRNLARCTMRGTPGNWCGVGEHRKCNFGAVGTPILTLRNRAHHPNQDRSSSTMSADTPQARMEALRARRAAAVTNPAIPAAVEAPAVPKDEPQQSAAPVAEAPAPTSVSPPPPAAEPGQPAPAALETSGVVPSAATAPLEAPKRRGRPSRPVPPPAPPGAANINPPDAAVAALAAMAREATAELAEVTTADHSEAGLLGLTPTRMSLGEFSLESLLGEIVRRVRAVAL